MGKRSGARHAFAYGRVPAKGTTARSVMLLMLRPQGVTFHELEAFGLAKGGTGTLGWLIEVLRSQKGWDVRWFKLDENDPRWRPARKPAGCYRIVGRWRWGGRYRSIGMDKYINDPKGDLRRGR